MASSLGELAESLQHVPHMLQLDILMRLDHELCLSIEEKLQAEKEGEIICKIDNYVSLLKIRHGDIQAALDLNERIRLKSPTNITALVNLAFMKMLSGETSEALKVASEIQALQERDNYEELLAEANAEQGYCLGRTRPWYYKDSVQFYEQALNINPLKYEWKFGCALSARRCLNLPKNVPLTKEETKMYCRTAVRHLQDIVENCPTTLLWSKALVELGGLCLLSQNPYPPLTKDLVEEFDIFKDCDPEEFFYKAISIPEAHDSEFVLGRCGVFFAKNKNVPYRDRLQEGYFFLKKAISLKTTSYACDNIAATLVKMAELGIVPVKSWRPGRVRSGSRARKWSRDSKPKRQSYFPHKPQASRLQRLPADNPCVREAMYYLQKRAEIKGTDHTGSYWLGLLLRRTGQLEDAIEVFRDVIKHRYSNAFSKASAYEQCGYCLRELCEGPFNEMDRKHYIDESHVMMTMCIQQSVKIFTQASGSELPLLKELFSGKGESDTMDWTELTRRIETHRMSLNFYDRLVKLDPLQPESMVNMIQKFMTAKEFHSALACLELVLCTSERRVILEHAPDLALQVYLGIARHLVTTGATLRNADLMTATCKSALDFQYGGLAEGDGEKWDVYILDDPDQTSEEADTLQNWLTDVCGLSVTRNDKGAPAMTEWLSLEANVVTSCTCMFVIIGERLSPRMERLVAAVEGQKKALPAVIVPVLTTHEDPPPILAGHVPIRCQALSTINYLLSCLMEVFGQDFNTFDT